MQKPDLQVVEFVICQKITHPLMHRLTHGNGALLHHLIDPRQLLLLERGKRVQEFVRGPDFQQAINRSGFCDPRSTPLNERV